MEKNMKHYNIEQDMRYLQLLSQSFPTIAEASTEIINLQAILNLPKGTEHFLADIHGEYEAFLHVLKNASGNIKRKVNELFGNTLREQEKRELCSLIYYPEQKLEYDRDSQNGRCGLYVYYRCPKAADGSWSVQDDQQILNIYAYEYATGAVAVSGKTSWGSAAAQAYLDLTGD